MNPFATKINGTPRVPLGELIVECDTRNSANLYTLNNLKGISIEKRFIETKANMDGVSLASYKLVKPNWFAFVPVTSRNGGKISLALNETDNTYIVSSAYSVMAVADEEKINPYYLFLMLQRSEFDRLARFNSWGSAREVYTFADLQRYEIPLPPIEVQREYVAAYRSLQQLAEQNEALAKPLQDACNAYLTEAKSKYDDVRLGDYILYSDARNGESYGLEDLRGVSIEKVFIPTKADMSGVSLRSYKVVTPLAFCYVPVTSRNGDKITIAVNNSTQTYICSSAYEVFNVKDSSVLLPEYLYLFFKRSEFDRLARFNSWGSARETFPYFELERVKIPLPPIEVQRSIVALYHCAEEARAIAREAREQLKILAPAMVQRAANTPTT